MPVGQPKFEAVGRFRSVDYVASTGSTNEDLVALARHRETPPRALIAGEQTAGKGRRGRSWQQPPGTGLSMSVWLPWKDQDTAFVLPICLGLAAVDAAAVVGAETRVGLKWPNDVVSLADGRKVGGLLAEAVAVGTDFRGVVCGIGCNLSWPGADDPLSAHATCLADLGDLGDTTPSVVEYGSAVLASFERRLNTLQSEGVGAVLESYRTCCVTIGQTVQVHRSNEVLSGEVLNVSDDGQLMLKTATETHHLATGDVAQLRPES